MTEAVSQLQKGLALLESLPDGTSRRQQELDLQVALISALSAKKGLRHPKSATRSPAPALLPNSLIARSTFSDYYLTS